MSGDPGNKLDDLIRDLKKDTREPDWKTLDEKLFARLDQEPRSLAKGTPSAEQDKPAQPNGRVVWIGASLTLAAAAAALLLVHPSRGTSDSRAAERSVSAGSVMSGDVVVHGSSARAGSQLSSGDRIEVESVAYFESPNATGSGVAARWVAQGGSVLEVEHAASPLVLSLEKGAAEAQVTPVPSGEAFAIDVTASSGALVRVAVHGTHLRVARDGDKVVIDLTEGVVSIGAPPRRGSTLGTLVTAPAHVELDARDLGTLRVDHTLSVVRTPEAVSASPRTEAETAFIAPSRQMVSSRETAPESEGTLLARPSDVRPQSQKPVPPSTTVPVVETWLRTSDEIASAIQACSRDSAMPNASRTTISTTFVTKVEIKTGDDGAIANLPVFNPPLPPEARECAANVLFKRSKFAANDDVTIAIEIKH